jgi:hypothetical protein
MSIEKLQEVSSELRAAKAKLEAFVKEQGRAAIGAAFCEVFAKHPEAAVFGWTQYTPYFNDGSACVFSVHEPYLVPASKSGDYSVWDYELWGEYPKEFSAECRDDFLAVWKTIDKQLLEAVFGDHVKITVTKDEVVVEDYNHD